MSTPSKPTIVILHGGWHVPASYHKLATALRAADFEVHVPRLLSVNEARPPNANLATDTALARSYVESLVEAGRTVIAVMHSYGGQVGTNALSGLGTKARAEKGLAGGVSHLVYVCAYAMPEGKSMVDKVREFGQEGLLPLVFDFAEDGTAVFWDARPVCIGEHTGEASEEEVQEYLGGWVRWNARCMYEELTVEKAAWREIEVVYVYTSKDVTVPFKYQKSMVEYLKGQGKEVREFTLETGHCPNVTATQGVVDAIKATADTLA